jgi:hypothetical protein
MGVSSSNSIADDVPIAQCPLRRAAPQQHEVVSEVRKGPRATSKRTGGNRPFQQRLFSMLPDLEVRRVCDIRRAHVAESVETKPAI